MKTNKLRNAFLIAGFCLFNTEAGKPFLIGPGASIKFSVSHSGDRLVLALGKNVTVGIDIEKKNSTQDLDVAEHVFSPQELAELYALPTLEQNSAFFKGWTQKEAFVKALGIGLSYPLKSLTVSLNPKENGRVVQIDQQDQEYLQHWEMQCLDIHSDYACSLFFEQSLTSSPVSYRIIPFYLEVAHGKIN